jgi:hypothetical protein
MAFRDDCGSNRLIWLARALVLLLPMVCSAQTASGIAAQFTTVVVPTGGDPAAVAVADVNHDGATDIIAANPNSGTVTVLLGDGKGHFHAATGSPFPAGHLPSDIGIGDFDGDGHPDLLVANHQAPYVTLLLGDGSGGFRSAPHSPFTTHARPHPHGVAVGHFCGEGQPLDAVIDSWGSGEVELLIGDGHGNLSNGPMFPAGPGSDMPLRSADFNHDGAPDIVMPDTAIGHWNSNEVSVLLGDGKCGFRAAPGSPFAGGPVPWTVAVGDLNGDDNPDFVIIPYGPQVRDGREVAATALLGDGKGGFRPMPGSPFALSGCANPYRLAIGAIGGDGMRGFAVTCMHSAKVLLFAAEKRGGYRVTALDIPSGKPGAAPAERGVAVADVRGVGKDDIIVTNGSAGTITLLLSK